MGTFFSKLFDTSDFPARWDCGNWDSAHGWLHIGSDLAIFGAYSIIPVTLAFYLWVKMGEVPFPRIFALFAAFIFSCGFTHFIEALIFYQPVYRFSGLMKLITAIVSWTTVLALLWIAPRALELPGQRRLKDEVEEERRRREKAETELSVMLSASVSKDIADGVRALAQRAEALRETLTGAQTGSLPSEIDVLLHEARVLENAITSRAAGDLPGSTATS